MPPLGDVLTKMSEAKRKALVLIQEEHNIVQDLLKNKEVVQEQCRIKRAKLDMVLQFVTTTQTELKDLSATEKDLVAEIELRKKNVSNLESMYT